MTGLRHAASFRDPSGFVFTRQGVLYRQVNQGYREHYDRLLASGLYDRLVKAGWLVAHQEVDTPPADPELAYRVIQPERLGFISYPYEWSFSQLKDAALATLTIEKMAIERGMTLKDASAYNIQFRHARPVLLDTLSFEVYREGEPWVAYRQFCQHFLAPLALASQRDIRLVQLARVYIDGIPLDLASGLLPHRSRLNFGLSTHIHLHAAAQQRYAGAGAPPSSQASRRMSKIAFLGLLDSLEGTVRGLNWKPAGTEWGDYYAQNARHYTNEALENKKKLVADYIQQAKPATVWDFGANTGAFSRLASQAGIPTVAFDIDPAAVEQNYLACKADNTQNMLPLVLDLTNPSPALGWHNRERMSVLERGPADLALALALIHHLAISNNLPLTHLAEFFAQAARWLVIEFVPKEDSQVQVLLATRQDIFPHYTQSEFERAFGERFTIHAQSAVAGTPRMLYLMERRG